MKRDFSLTEKKSLFISEEIYGKTERSIFIILRL